MKLAILAFVSAFVLSMHEKKDIVREEVELVCTKRHSTTNTCHYNFRIGGINYHYKDIGCKGKKDTIIKDVKEGKLGLAKEWKIQCDLPKEKPAL